MKKYLIALAMILAVSGSGFAEEKKLTSNNNISRIISNKSVSKKKFAICDYLKGYIDHLYEMDKYYKEASESKSVSTLDTLVLLNKLSNKVALFLNYFKGYKEDYDIGKYEMPNKINDTMLEIFFELDICQKKVLKSAELVSTGKLSLNEYQVALAKEVAKRDELESTVFKAGGVVPYILLDMGANPETPVNNILVTSKEKKELLSLLESSFGEEVKTGKIHKEYNNYYSGAAILLYESLKKEWGTLDSKK